MSNDAVVSRGASKTGIHAAYMQKYSEYLDYCDCTGFTGTFQEWLKQAAMDDLYAQQEVYEEYWVKNAWGFGDKMRDYLMSGMRRIRHGTVSGWAPA